jgi:predicted HicB family RNase H-like nuclease
MKTKATETKVGDWKQLTTRIPPEVHRALRIRAAEEDRSCAEIVEELIRQYLAARKEA